MSEENLPHIGIVGLGLIGGSLAKSLRRAGMVVSACDTDVATQQAASRDDIRVVGSVDELASAVDVLVVCAPTSALPTILTAVCEAVGEDGPVVTDVISVKSSFHQFALVHADEFPGSFVGGHPMAGTEFSGYDNAMAELFTNRPWAVAFEPYSGLEAFMAVVQLALATGAYVVPVESGEHDEAVAQISHLPHVLATVMARVAEESGVSSVAMSLAGPSFRDATRVASSSPEFLRQLIAYNGPRVKDVLSVAKDLIDNASSTLGPDASGLAAERSADAAGSLLRFFQKGHEARAALLKQTGEERDAQTIARVVDVDAVRSEVLAAGRAGGRIVRVQGIEGGWLLHWKVPAST